MQCLRSFMWILLIIVGRYITTYQSKCRWKFNQDFSFSFHLIVKIESASGTVWVLYINKYNNGQAQSVKRWEEIETVIELQDFKQRKIPDKAQLIKYLIEEYSLLSCNGVQFRENMAFQRNQQKQAASWDNSASTPPPTSTTSAGFLLVFLRVSMFPQTLGCLQTTLCYNPEDNTPQSHCQRSPKFGEDLTDCNVLRT